MLSSVEKAAKPALSALPAHLRSPLGVDTTWISADEVTAHTVKEWYVELPEQVPTMGFPCTGRGRIQEIQRLAPAAVWICDAGPTSRILPCAITIVWAAQSCARSVDHADVFQRDQGSIHCDMAAHTDTADAQSRPPAGGE